MHTIPSGLRFFGFRLKSVTKVFPSAMLMALLFSWSHILAAQPTDTSSETVRFIPPWEPHQAVVLALPLQANRDNAEIQEVFKTLAGYVTEYCDVLICYSYRERELLPYYIKLFENDKTIQSNPGKVELVESEVNSLWIRDFGPLFGVETDGSVTIYNNRYETLSDDLDALKSRDPRTHSESDLDALQQQSLRNQARKEDARTNSYLSTALKYLYEMDVSVEKTDLSIQGGDVMYMGNGKFLTGESSILLNQLSRRKLAETIKGVFGFSEVHFLPNLPGSAANHLDMNMMVIDEKNVILNEVPLRNKSQRIYMDYLYNRISKVSTTTENLLKKNFPNVTIHRIPALPLIPDSPELVVSKWWNIIFTNVGRQIGVAWDRVIDRPENDRQRVEASNRIIREIASHIGAFDPSNPADLNRVLRYYLDSDLAEEDLIHTDSITFYRTYSNSLFVRSIDGRELFVLPRYKGRTKHEIEIIPDLEKQVEAAYKAARPNAAIKWLDVDPIIEQLGAIHCFTSTVPYIPAP